MKSQFLQDKMKEIPHFYRNGDMQRVYFAVAGASSEAPFWN